MVKNDGQAYWCIVEGSDLWIQNGELPFEHVNQLEFATDSAVQIGVYDDSPVYWLNASEVEPALTMLSLRDLLHFPEPLFLLISRAIQFGHMAQSIRFCPQCGGRTHLNLNQLAMQCKDCRTLHYPRIFPCIIVAVRKENQILLAQHPRHKGNMYTVIAGFVEVGETLEQCVAREVKEETGIDVCNIRYQGSQPWAFPTSLMVGFFADYAGGEVKPDYNELSDAQWFNVDNLPEIAPRGTIARELIENLGRRIKMGR
ncbi:NAD(+) diphosphatase [Vibrio tapetis subsp. quintayensis]|uniref:NAD(+) diphosphatase n=1 Tax=Vibrio tapetis TaxID=52443 RepID=UPI0025B3AB8B|nr:NAD(+) diphosphatase [Vibrio tapetis]MDN3678914.1 NAD(+) diphosphatase [Vibrio tapetis subsp. quintayensis]